MLHYLARNLGNFSGRFHAELENNEPLIRPSVPPDVQYVKLLTYLLCVFFTVDCVQTRLWCDIDVDVIYWAFVVYTLQLLPLSGEARRPFW